jgi:hypothetical protein
VGLPFRSLASRRSSRRIPGFLAVEPLAVPAATAILSLDKVSADDATLDGIHSGDADACVPFTDSFFDELWAVLRSDPRAQRRLAELQHAEMAFEPIHPIDAS